MFFSDRKILQVSRFSCQMWEILWQCTYQLSPLYNLIIKQLQANFRHSIKTTRDLESTLLFWKAEPVSVSHLPFSKLNMPIFRAFFIYMWSALLHAKKYVQNYITNLNPDKQWPSTYYSVILQCCSNLITSWNMSLVLPFCERQINSQDRNSSQIREFRGQISIKTCVFFCTYVCIIISFYFLFLLQ